MTLVPRKCYRSYLDWSKFLRCGQVRWQEIVAKKHLLFDNDAIATISGYKADSIYARFQSLEATCCYIHPTHLEMLRVDRAIEIVLRQKTISQYFIQIPFIAEDFARSSHIQAYLATKNCKPSVVDLYLASMIARFHHDNILLLTANLKDFPHPLFIRKGGIVFHNEKSTKTLSLLSFNHNELAPF